MRFTFFGLASCVVLMLATSCGEKPSESTGPDPTRGRRLYIATCIVCHNMDPSQPGSLGPAIKGASEALLVAKVLHKRYPANYTPQRPTIAMPTYPQLKNRIPDIAAFLAQP
jgi:mono/diheme cytochrome c family protein